MQSMDLRSRTIMRNLVIRELQVMSCIHHPNIVNLLAIIYDSISQESCDRSIINPENFALVYERPCLGTMYEYIQRNQENTLSTLSALIISCQISEALIFLHSSGIIHCGVTPHAVYVYAEYKVKLGKFEYSQYIQTSNDSVNDGQYHSDDSLIHKSRLHHRHHEDYDFFDSSHKLPSILNLLLGIYCLPDNYLKDWLPLELYDSSKLLFQYAKFSLALQSLSIEEICQTIKPCTTSDVYSLAKFIQFILPSIQETMDNTNIYLYNMPNSLLTLICSALKSSPDERLSMRQFNRLLIHLYWVERDRDQSNIISIDNIPPCSLRLCNHKWKPRYCEPIPHSYSINQMKPTSPVQYQTLSDATDKEKSSNSSKSKLFSCLSTTNPDNAEIVSDSTQSINQNYPQSSISHEINCLPSPVRKITTQIGKQQYTKKQKRSWHKIFMHKKRTTSTKPIFHKKHHDETTWEVKLSNVNEIQKSVVTSSYSSDCFSDGIHQSIQPTNSGKQNVASTSKSQPYITDWLKRRRYKLSSSNRSSPDVNIKFNNETGSTPMTRVDAILSKSPKYSFNLAENDKHRKACSLFTRFRLPKSEYVYFAAVPMLPEGVDVNPNLNSRKNPSSFRQTPLSYSSFKSPNIPLTSLSNDSNALTTCQDISGSNFSGGIRSIFSSWLDKSTNSKFDITTPMKPASHLTQLLSSSVDNPNVSGRIDLIRTSSLLARRQQNMRRIKNRQDLNASSPMNNLRSSKLSDIKSNPSVFINQRVNSLPIMKNTVKHSTGCNILMPKESAFRQLSFQSNVKKKSTDNCDSSGDTLKMNGRIKIPLKSLTNNCNDNLLSRDCILVEKQKNFESVDKSGPMLKEAVGPECHQKKNIENVELGQSLTSKSSEKSHLVQCESSCESIIPVPNESIGVQCSVMEVQHKKSYKTCDASAQTEANDSKNQYFSEISELYTTCDNQQSLSIYNSLSLNDKMMQISPNEFYELSHRISLNSLCDKDSSESLHNRTLCKQISNSMVEIHCPSNIQKPISSKLYRSASFHLDRTKFINDRLMNERTMLQSNINLKSNISSWQNEIFHQTNQQSLKLSSSAKFDEKYYNFLNVPLTSTISSNELCPFHLYQYNGKTVVSDTLFSSRLCSERSPSSHSKRTPLSEIQSNNNCQLVCQVDNSLNNDSTLAISLTSLNSKCVCEHQKSDLEDSFI
ncbi:Inactive serine/threonine-protein kinase TEX14 [Schistosoma japonicum]|nr:Inactive serine/threonine-protein kinase TEX14 [Schistosoma japonicum]